MSNDPRGRFSHPTYGAFHQASPQPRFSANSRVVDGRYGRVPDADAATKLLSSDDGPGFIAGIVAVAIPILALWVFGLLENIF